MKKLKHLLWLVMQAYWRWKFSKKAILRGKVFFGRHSRIQLSDGSRREDIIIEKNVKLYGTLISQACGKILISESAHVGPNTTIGAAYSVSIGAFAMISKNVEIMDNNNHPTHPEDRRKINSDHVASKFKGWRYSKSAAIYIGENTWIGRDSTIMKGVNLGANSIVGACAVVTKSVESNVVVAGNPAKVVKREIQDESRLL